MSFVEEMKNLGWVYYPDGTLRAIGGNGEKVVIEEHITKALIKGNVKPLRPNDCSVCPSCFGLFSEGIHLVPGGSCIPF